MYLPQCTSATRVKLHEPNTLHLICTVHTYNMYCTSIDHALTYMHLKTLLDVNLAIHFKGTLMCMLQYVFPSTFTK